MAAADYWSQAQIDPAYLAAHGSNKQALIQAILGYGSTNALSPDVAAQYGIQPTDISAANQNPYSVQAQLAKQLSGDQYAIGNTAQAHGATFSGANAAAQAHEQQNAAQRNYNAQQQLASQISGIQGNDTSALTNAYGSIATNALNTPTPAVAPAPNLTPPQPTPGQTYLPGGGVTGPPAPAASAGPREFIPPVKVKAPPLPKLATGYLGHA